MAKPMATAPRPLTRAPPELPGEMAASVWTRSTSERMPCSAEPGISRCRPEMMPAVMVFWNPSGLPIATASSPTAGSCSWKVAGRRSFRSTSTTARSVSGSVARTRPPARRPSKKATSTVRTSPTTWALVTTTPSLDQTTPLPVPWSWLMVTTDGSTLRTIPGMSLVAAAWAPALAGTAVTGAGVERACGARVRLQPARTAASAAASSSSAGQGGCGQVGGCAYQSSSEPVGLQQAQPDLADGRERRHGVPQPLQRDLAGHGHGGRVEQLLGPGAGEGGPDQHPSSLVHDQLAGPGDPVALDIGPGHPAGVGPDHLDVEAGPPGLGLGGPDGADLRVGEGDPGHHAVVGQVGGVAAQDGVAGHPPLVLAHVGQGGEPVAVADGVQPAAVDPLGPQPAVDPDRPVPGQPDRVQADVAGAGAAAGGDQHLVADHLVAVAQGHRDRPAGPVAADRGDLGPGAHGDALGLEGVLDLAAGERLLAGQQALAPDHHRHLLAAEAPERLGQLAADRAAAQHDQPTGHLGGPGRSPVVPGP